MSPKELSKQPDQMLQQRRRKATAKELAQGQDEMRRAQDRLDAERSSGTVQPIEDVKPEEVPIAESPPRSSTAVAVVDQSLEVRTQERMSVPVGSPSALGPPVMQEVAPTPGSESKSLAPRQQVQDSRSEEKPKESGRMEVRELRSVEAEGKTKETLRSEEMHLEQERLRTPGVMSQPNVTTPATPLFTDDQLRRLQDLYSQAPWLYGLPQNPTGSSGGVLPPLRRPLFLEMEEQRMSSMPMTSVPRPQLPVTPHPVPSGMEDNQQMVYDLLQENERLRSRLDQMEDGSGKFATPEDDAKVVKKKDKRRSSKDKDREVRRRSKDRSRRSKEAARPPVKEVWKPPIEEADLFTKEADRPPKEVGRSEVEEALGQGSIVFEGSCQQEAARPPPPNDRKPPSKEAEESPKEAARPPEGKPKKQGKSLKQNPPDGSSSPSSSSEGDPVSSSSTATEEEERRRVRRSRRRSTSSDRKEKTVTLSIMLQLMQGMQSLQKKIMEGKDGKEETSEYVRGTPSLPQLPEWSSASGPIDMNDWLALIDPMMSDLTDSSGEWWSLLMQEATTWYQQHMQLQPLERMAHVPAPSEELSKPRWKRLEKRASTLLLMAVPEGQREELIACKKLTALSIICQLLVSYKPGGLAEKELILRSLEFPNESSTLSEAIQALRRWTRWRRRAAELKISEPDPFLLLKGLNRIIKKPLEQNRELTFRISLARSMLQVDSAPNSGSVTSFAQHLLAEFEQIAHQETSQASAKKKTEEKAKAVKLRRLEEEEKKGEAGKKAEEGKAKCKFYLTDAGCRRGKTCTFSHDVKDEKRRCWTCGSTEHFSSQCSRPKGGSEGSPSKARLQKAEGEGTPTGGSKDVKKEELEGEGDSSMKQLLEQATKMLKSMNDPSSSGSTSSAASVEGESKESREDTMERLQQQLNAMKMKVFRISQISGGGVKGLIDSGATHPLRSEKIEEKGVKFKKVPVTLASGQVTWIKMNNYGTMLTEDPQVEPIVPMGKLTQTLGCSVEWKNGVITLCHPERGLLPVKAKDGCPQVSQELALQLIEELEEKEGKFRLQSVDFAKEDKWLQGLVDSHPVLRTLPSRMKDHLAVEVGRWEDLPLNRRRRKKAQRDGLHVHLYAGESDGFTLERAWKQSGGKVEDLLELDIKRDERHDMLASNGIYSALLRIAFEGKLHSIVGGPNCRTRSVLRHRPIPGNPSCPRPLRAWNGGEHGIQGLTKEEEESLRQDDLLLWRMVFLFLVAKYVREARQIPKPVGFLLEQPASPKDFEPEVVSWWDTTEWKALQEDLGLSEITFRQGALGGAAPKPTTVGTNLEIDVEKHEMKRGEHTKEVKGSKDLARWAPGLMNSVAQAILEQVVEVKIKLKPLSWSEHLSHGHIPFRRDCWICQQSIQQQAPHRKVDQPIGGVLSLDTVGPLASVPDMGGFRARYLGSP